MLRSYLLWGLEHVGRTLSFDDKAVGLEVVGVHEGLAFRDPRDKQLGTLYSAIFIML